MNKRIALAARSATVVLVATLSLGFGTSLRGQEEPRILRIRLGAETLSIEASTSLRLGVMQNDEVRTVFFGPSAETFQEAIGNAEALAGQDGAINLQHFWYDRRHDGCDFPSALASLCSDANDVRVESVLLESVLGDRERPEFPRPEVVREVVDGVSILVNDTVVWGDTRNLAVGFTICAPPPLAARRDCVFRAIVGNDIGLRGDFSLADQPLVPERETRDHATAILLEAAKGLLAAK